MTLSHDIARAVASHKPRSDLRKQHVSHVTTEIAEENQLTDAIARHVNEIVSNLASLSKLTAHDERAFQLARQERSDLELTHARLGRLIEALR
jgi:tRNA U55 pseudouridine synthase TruB